MCLQGIMVVLFISEPDISFDGAATIYAKPFIVVQLNQFTLVCTVL